LMEQLLAGLQQQQQQQQQPPPLPPQNTAGMANLYTAAFGLWGGEPSSCSRAGSACR
jgi:hypothetical protein